MEWFIAENNIAKYPYIIYGAIPTIREDNNINNHLKFAICTVPNCKNLVVCLEPKHEICGRSNENFHNSPRTELHYHCQQLGCDFVYFPIYANMDYSGMGFDYQIIIGLSDHKHCDAIIDGKKCHITTHHTHCSNNDYDETENYKNSTEYIDSHGGYSYDYYTGDAEEDSDSNAEEDGNRETSSAKLIPQLVPDPYKQNNPHIHCDYKFDDEKCLTNRVHSHCPVEGCNYLYESVYIPPQYDIYYPNRHTSNHNDVIIFQNLDAESQILIQKFFQDNSAMDLFNEADLSKSLAKIYKKLKGAIPATILQHFRFKDKSDNILKSSRLNNLRYCTSYHVHCPECSRTDFHYHCNVTIRTTKLVNKKTVFIDTPCRDSCYHTHCINDANEIASACTEDHHLHCDICHIAVPSWCIKRHKKNRHNYDDGTNDYD